MVDEPSIGLAPIVVNDIFKILEMLNREGYTILLSEQNANKALKCAHRGYVLETGVIALSGTAAQLLADPGRQGRLSGSVACRYSSPRSSTVCRWGASTCCWSPGSTSCSWWP